MNTQFAINNERLLEKAIEAGIEIRSFDGWKRVGKFVKKGEKQMQVRVVDGSYGEYNPVTGESVSVPKYAMAFGFTANQVR